MSACDVGSGPVLDHGYHFWQPQDSRQPAIVLPLMSEAWAYQRDTSEAWIPPAGTPMNETPGNVAHNIEAWHPSRYEGNLYGFDQGVSVKTDTDMGTPSSFGGSLDDGPFGQVSLYTDKSQGQTGQANFGQLSHATAHVRGGQLKQEQMPNSADRRPQTDRRPVVGPRAITAPEPSRSNPRRNADSNATPDLKRNPSDSTEEENVPGETSKVGRGRRRQRIPHTAVERRYRENLNAHLDKLRQAVPALRSKRAEGSAKAVIAPNPMKPSKCEILNGAIDWINHLDRENQQLKVDSLATMSRLEQLERWYAGQGYGN